MPGASRQAFSPAPYTWPAAWASPNQNDSASLTCAFRIAYGAIQVMFRAGANPTGIRAVSFKDLISTTETLFVCSFAT